MNLDSTKIAVYICIVLCIGALAYLPFVAKANDMIPPQQAITCMGCHGADGISVIAGYPNLAGQNREYLVAQLKAFRSMERTGGQSVIMYGMSAGLSDEDIEELADYYSKL